MRSKTILALVLLNIALVAALFFPNMFGQSAKAVIPAGRPSEYLMVAGEVQGGTSGVVFTVDTRAKLLTAFVFDGKRLEAMPPIDLSRVFK